MSSSASVEPIRFTTLVLAGSRPGGDPLAMSVGLTRKALIPVCGVPMLSRVLRALRASPWVGDIFVCGLDDEALATCAEVAESGLTAQLTSLPAAANPSESVVAALDRLGFAKPLLVVTGDHALLTPAMLAEFCAKALAQPCDVVASVVDAERVRAAYPDALRTFYPFRDGAFTGCNLFAFRGPAGRKAAEAWLYVERHRKRPWRSIALLGPGILVRFLLRRLTLDGAAEALSRRLGIVAKIVRMTIPEAGIDVDKPTDLEMAEKILARR